MAPEFPKEWKAMTWEEYQDWETKQKSGGGEKDDRQVPPQESGDEGKETEEEHMRVLEEELLEQQPKAMQEDTKEPLMENVTEPEGVPQEETSVPSTAEPLPGGESENETVASGSTKAPQPESEQQATQEEQQKESDMQPAGENAPDDVRDVETAPTQQDEEEPEMEGAPVGDVRGSGPFNPDRVRTEEHTGRVVETIPPEERYTVTERVETITERPSFMLRFFSPGARARMVGLTAAAISILGSIGVNIGNERSVRGNETSLSNATTTRKALQDTSMEEVVKQTQEEVCKLVNVEFLQRFIQKDANGVESINPGAAIMPFSVALEKDCTSKMDIELHIPYDFARTFNEIIVTNPAQRDALLEKLADHINNEVQNQLVIKGIAGVTGTTYVYNREHNILVAGASAVSVNLNNFSFGNLSGLPPAGSDLVEAGLGTLSVDNLEISGHASAEAERSVQHSGAESLPSKNPENITLAGKRLQDAMPLILEALEKAGVNPEDLKNRSEFTAEHNLSDEEMASLAEIAHDTLGGVVVGSDRDQAFALIKEINDGNPVVLKAIESNPAYASVIEKTLNETRGVTVTFTATVEHGKTEVYSVVIPIALALFLLPSVRLQRTEGSVRVVRTPVVVENPPVETIRDITTSEPVARRLFSETTPGTLEKERSFDEVYADTNLHERAEDAHVLLEHVLLEEVLPSLDEETKEPLIDYEDVVNASREYLMSDSRRDGIEKGSYHTTEEAQRVITEKLLEMWERHDVQTYPMEGIDIKTVINYRHSPHVVFWAKTLAECFVRIAAETTTRDEFRTKLLGEIRQAAENREKRGQSARNTFVRSDFPPERIG